MSLVINHNTTALNAHRNLGLSAGGMSKAIEKLSSGYKINVGADDPSGLIISEQLRSQISGLERAVRNSSEAYNLIGIAEGALNEMNTILKKMRALAIHAASNGVTSPEQVAADQSEMDSGIDTLNRIANTTRYSDQYLLNGAKQLVYEDHVLVDEPTDHQLLDTKMTRVDQIFKRDGMRVSIGFAGDESDSKANTQNSAKRAYLEADNANGLCQIDGGKLTADQEFTLTGSGGSRMFNFTKGEHIGKMVQGVNNSKDSTGIGATLIFASDVRIDKTSFDTGGVAKNLHGRDVSDPLNPFSVAAPYEKGQIQIYKAGLNSNKPKIDDYEITSGVADAFRVGYNTDGDGKIYAKVVDVAAGSIEYYKDKECTMLIGKGDGTDFTPANNSGIPGSPLNATEGIKLTLNKDNAKALDVYEIAVVGQNMDNDKDMTVTGLGGFADVGNAVMSGVNLGVNTSAEGKIFFNYQPLSYYPSGEVKTFKMEAYTDGSFDPKYLVGSSGVMNADVNALPPGDHTQAVRIESVPMADGQDSGLNITINVPTPPGTARLPKIAQPGTVEFTNLGVRLYSTDYGSQETIRMQNNKGELFYQYRSHDTIEEKIMVKPDTTVQVAGNDAKITVNGSPIFTTGLIANTTTPDFSGSLVFNAGSLGKGTIAVTGYEDGKIYSKATALQGEEEKETEIQQSKRNFDFEGFYCSTGAATLPQVYFDLSSLESMAESKLLMAGVPPAGTIEILSAEAATTTAQGKVEFSINGGASLGVINIDYEDMKKGVYLAEPEELKGLFVKIAQPNTPSTSGLPTPPVINYTEGDPLLEMNSYATQPRGSTSEEMTNFKGGMQFQLGNTEGDQDRTIYSVPSMAMSNLGRIEWAGEEYTLQSVLGGGKACLAKDPVLAMRILAQAVDDVSGLRARLGAFQQNMLQSNMNALEVAVENITKTESAIRDTDMAAESTQFTRFQIMQQAGTSMLAQANQVSQNVLSLLQ